MGPPATTQFSKHPNHSDLVSTSNPNFALVLSRHFGQNHAPLGPTASAERQSLMACRPRASYRSKPYQIWRETTGWELVTQRGAHPRGLSPL